MTEFTDKQLAAVSSVLIGRVDTKIADKILAELRPKSKFAKEQVVYLENSDTYHRFNNVFRASRALTLTEMGPLVRELRDYVAGAGLNFNSADELAKRFDEVHGDA